MNRRLFPSLSLPYRCRRRQQVGAAHADFALIDQRGAVHCCWMVVVVMMMMAPMSSVVLMVI